MTDQVLEWTYVAMAVITLIAPLIVAIVKLTAWGRAHEEALDNLVDAVDQAKRTGKTATVLSGMRAREATASPRAVTAWRRIVARRKKREGAK